MKSADIALRNVKKSLRDYAVYFLTLTFGVCIFYVFNALESQQEIMNVTKSQAAIFKELGSMMDAISAFISIILGFLIVYANRFLIKRRKKEFGVYLMLGMEKLKVSGILVMETLYVGFFSLLAGLAMGVMLSQGMALVTAKLLQASVSSFKFMFSSAALLKTIIYFGVIFLLALIFNTYAINKQTLVGLLYANRKNESFKTPRLSISVAIFLLAIGCLGYAYKIVLGVGPSSIITDFKSFTAAVSLGAAGTFLFFFSMSGFFLKLIQQSKSLYLKNLNMFVLRQINSKINTAYVSMTMVCLMLFVSVCTLSTGMGLSSNISGKMKEEAPFDASLTAYGTQDENGSPVEAYPGYDLVAAAKEQGLDLDALSSRYLAVRYYGGEKTIDLELENDSAGIILDTKAVFIKLSDYNAVLEMEGLAPITLGENEYAVNYAPINLSVRKAMDKYMENADVITLRGVDLRTSPKNLRRYILEVSKNLDYDANIIVNDELVEGLPILRDTLHMNYLIQNESSERMFREKLSGIRLSANSKLQLLTREDVMETSNSATTMVTYLSVYLGIIFLIAAASVLAIGQLSETSDNIYRYGLLRKLGTDDKMINKALLSQISIYFGVPMMLAIVHSVVGISAADRLVINFDRGNILSGSLFTSCIILIIYFGYFLATYHGGKGILTRDYYLQRKGIE
ncbi:MAG: ABC transporter permease [Clostridiales bacterium]|nr:ABC transporter permease [Clostridiales bacterium]